MAPPAVLVARFPPSPSDWLDVSRRLVDDAILQRIAGADYGYRQEEAFAVLRGIRGDGVLPISMVGEIAEVLELTRWSDPERPDRPPFEAGRAGREGHAARFFACALLFRMSSDPACPYEDACEDGTLVKGLISAGVLGAAFNAAAGSFLTWRCRQHEESVWSAIALLVIALRLRSNRMAEPDLRAIAEWVATQDAAAHVSGHWEQAPHPFSVQQGMWEPVRLEMRHEAATIFDPTTRELVNLCTLLLTPE